MIRPATIGDLTDLGLFCLECQQVMPWGHHGLTMDIGDTMQGLLDFMVSPLRDLSVVDLGDGVSGACAVGISQYPLGKDRLIASEWIWHMRPSFPDGVEKRKWVVRMLDHMLSWSRAMGAHVFKANTVHGDGALVSLLQRRGISPMETCCVGEL